MSIVNLSKRVTKDHGVYNSYAQSSDSLIYIEGDYAVDEKSPDCLSLSVGDAWYNKGQYVKIGEKGVKVRPHSGIVIKTKEKINLPLNVYGILFGSGQNIYRGAFVSNGKIDPGFRGNLKIGYHNAGSETIILRPGDKLAYALFLTSECEIPSTVENSTGPEPDILPTLGVKERISRWWHNNASIILSTISTGIALVSLLRQMTQN